MNITGAASGPATIDSKNTTQKMMNQTSSSDVAIAALAAKQFSTNPSNTKRTNTTKLASVGGKSSSKKR